MKDYRFRAWHIQDKEMLYESCKGDVFKWLKEGQPIIIMQFTGLTDINGKDAYEGDIIKTCNHSYNYDHEPPYYNVIKYNDFMCGFIPFCEVVYYDGEYYLDCFEFEIIGNIYKNKDLYDQLKKEQKLWN